MRTSGRSCRGRSRSRALGATASVEFLLEDVGPGHRSGCASCEPGEELWALGPLGRGFTRAPAEARALLVGGGIGIAPLVDPPGRAGRGGLATVRCSASATASTRRRPRSARPALATDDGSVGHHGLVTELLDAELDATRQRRCLRLRAARDARGRARDLRSDATVPAQLALEAAMACGFGACYGCVVPRRGGGYLRVCVDGPVLDARRAAECASHERRVLRICGSRTR